LGLSLVGGLPFAPPYSFPLDLARCEDSHFRPALILKQNKKQDFCMAAWAYSLWLLVKRLFLSITLNTIDGSANAILALVIQSVDTGLLLFTRPFINRQAELTECFGAITNLLVTIGQIVYVSTPPIRIC
jgi:hypothetical protein